MTYDLVVIGAGPGGYVAAIRAAQLGWKTACVEKDGRLGGTCLRVGCIPSKALLESSEVFRRAKACLDHHGVRLRDVQLDLATMMKRKEKIVADLARGIDGLFKKHAIDRIEGLARIQTPSRVIVERAGETTTLETERVLIATGSRPATLKDVEPDSALVGTSTEALSYEEVPEHLVVIGAGYIGLELGSVWRRLGARVTVIEFLDRILPGMDSELASEALKILEEQGLEFRLGTRVRGARVEGGGCRVEIDGGDTIHCARVLVAVGRVPNTEGLGLADTGVETDDKGRIIVDDDYCSSVAGIYAIGDVISGPMLAHRAQEEGVAVVEKLATGYGHVDYNAIPGVVYVEPEIAAVGKTEEEVKQTGIPYRKGLFHFRANGRARVLDATEGWVKVIAHGENDRLLGVHVIGSRAGDLIAEAATAMAFGASSEDLARVCHAHPTLSEALKEAALAVDERPLHA